MPGAAVVVCVEREHGAYKSCSQALTSRFGESIKLVHFSSARDALSFISASETHLVISSLMQSEINGIDLLNDCKDLKPNLPFIIHTVLEYKEDFFAWGHKPDAYIVRSPDPSALLEAISKLLRPQS